MIFEQTRHDGFFILALFKLTAIHLVWVLDWVAYMLKLKNAREHRKLWDMLHTFLSKSSFSDYLRFFLENHKNMYVCLEIHGFGFIILFLVSSSIRLSSMISW